MSLAHALDLLKDGLSTLTACCNSSSSLAVNGRKYKILRLLGEGGFSFVYLAEDEETGRKYALKKIRCESRDDVQNAMKEVEAYMRFRHPNCIRCLDSAVIQDNEGKIIYLFLPFYSKGNIQDAINEHTTSKTSYKEKEMLQLFHGTCMAVRALHTHSSEKSTQSTASSSGSYPPSSNMETEDVHEADQIEDNPEAQALMGAESSGRQVIVDESEASSVPGLGEGDSKTKVGKRIDPMSAKTTSAPKEKTSGPQPWAHRDIKPANIMINDSGLPVLMDFGSALPARIPIPNRSVALAQADDAAEHCSMPYRAPELFDPPVGQDLNEKVDIWSLGCTLYAMAFNRSPFEMSEGTSIPLAARSGNYKIPEKTQYSDTLSELIKVMMTVDPQKRPDIHKIIELTESALAKLG